MTEIEIKTRIDKLEHIIFIEQMAENYNASYINTCRAEIRALKKQLEDMGGRWSE